MNDLLCPNRNALRRIVAVDQPLNQKTDCPRTDVPNNACCAVVKTMWKTFVNRTVKVDLNNSTNLGSPQFD
jgi:hypothetical protein